jgi:(p)ppGpp synthase/HD superfamily hydrolase
MHSYAQTNIQLFLQLRGEDYSQSDISVVCRAYELAIQLCSGLYRPSGKTFIAHLVGTASILGSLRLPINLVTAGLLHSTYTHGDFGAGPGVVTAADRQEVKRIVGADCEEYIARYAELVWNLANMQTVYAKLDELDGIDRDVILIRLANELEDLLDRGSLYCATAEHRTRHRQTVGQLILDIAKSTGVTRLTAELEALLDQSGLDEIPLELRQQSRPAFLVPPSSSRRKPAVAFRQEVIARLRRAASALARRAGKLRRFLNRRLSPGGTRVQTP